MSGKWLRLLAGSLPALACACGPGSPAGPDADAGADTLGECVPPAEADLEGAWALRAFVRLEMLEDPAAVIHVCDDPPVALATVTWLVRMEPEAGGEAGLAFRSCAIELPQVTASFADCTLGETFVAYLMTSDALDGSLPLVERSGLARTEVRDGCLGFESDDLFVRIGIPSDLADTVPLPGWDLSCTGTTAIECVPGFETNVLDTDSDGSPGVTFEIDTDPSGLVEGMAWATLRHTPNPRGTVLGATSVSGRLEPVLEYDVVGSDASMSGLPIDTPTVKRNLPRFVPIAEGSYFLMVRIDGRHGSVDLGGGDGVITCDEVNASPGLFD